MIFLWGLASDSPLATVRLELARLGRTAVLLDQRAILDTRVAVEVADDVACTVEQGGVRLDLARATAAYLRPYDPFAVPQIAQAGVGSAAWRHAVSAYEALRVWSELSRARIVNRLSAMASNASKPYQCELIRAAGFTVPETLVTTDPDEAAVFCDAHPNAIYKSVSGVRSVVARVSDDARGRFAAVAACPTQFQAFVPGVDHRVHVVGDRAVACELTADGDDYRYARQVKRRLVPLPDDVSARCVALARALRLNVAGIDLRRTPAGDWVCFEVNPSPAYSYFDLDGAISRLIAAHLAAA